MPTYLIYFNNGSSCDLSRFPPEAADLTVVNANSVSDASAIIGTERSYRMYAMHQNEGGLDLEFSAGSPCRSATLTTPVAPSAIQGYGGGLSFGGTTHFVTNTASSGTGSLSAAISAASSGDIIQADNSLGTAPNSVSGADWINGSYTPPSGVHLLGRSPDGNSFINLQSSASVTTLDLSSVTGVQVSHVAVRNGLDCVRIRGGGKTIALDHCTFSNPADEMIDYAGNGGSGLKNITISHCVFNTNNFGMLGNDSDTNAQPNTRLSVYGCWFNSIQFRAPQTSGAGDSSNLGHHFWNNIYDVNTGLGGINFRATGGSCLIEEVANLTTNLVSQNGSTSGGANVRYSGVHNSGGGSISYTNSGIGAVPNPPYSYSFFATGSYSAVYNYVTANAGQGN